MRAFAYAQPENLKEAVRLLGPSWHDGVALAGGTDLISLMKDGVDDPERLVSLKRVKELRRLEVRHDGLRVGAMVTLAELTSHVAVRESFPALADAANLPSQQIRNMGTVGGELLQRPRCWYYRNGYGLLGQLDGKALIPQGDNRYHAIFGNAGPAYFVSASSLAPLLIAYGASVRIAGPRGARTLALEKLFTIPARAGERETVLAPNEILSEIFVPAPAAETRAALYEVRQKTALDWPLAAAAVTFRLVQGKVQNAAVVLGHVAPIPWRSPEAAEAINGKAVAVETAAAAGAAAVAKATPLSRNAYKVQLTRVAVKRALLRAAGEEV
jgi:xanthine dehydrogenase YagS FAD-binding subunit